MTIYLILPPPPLHLTDILCLLLVEVQSTPYDDEDSFFRSGAIGGPIHITATPIDPQPCNDIVRVLPLRRRRTIASLLSLSILTSHTAEVEEEEVLPIRVRSMSAPSFVNTTSTPTNTLPAIFPSPTSAQEASSSTHNTSINRDTLPSLSTDPPVVASSAPPLPTPLQPAVPTPLSSPVSATYGEAAFNRNDDSTTLTNSRHRGRHRSQSDSQQQQSIHTHHRSKSKSPVSPAPTTTLPTTTTPTTSHAHIQCSHHNCILTETIGQLLINEHCHICRNRGIKYSCLPHNFDICHSCYNATRVIKTVHHTCILTVNIDQRLVTGICSICNKGKGVKYSCKRHRFHICEKCVI